MPSYSVSIKGLAELERIPGWLDEAQKEFLHGAVVRIGKAVGDAAPKKSGKLEASWKGEATSSTTGRV